MKTAKTIKSLRQFAQSNFGPRRMRITKNGDVHVYSQMPNSIVTGWWLVGDLEAACIRFFGPEITAASYK